MRTPQLLQLLVVSCLLPAHARAQDASGGGEPAPDVAPLPEAGASEPAPSAEPAADLTTPEGEGLPEGMLPERSKGVNLRGYLRSEFKHHVQRVETVTNPWTGLPTEVGSPYQVYDLLPLAEHEGYVEANFELKYQPVDRFIGYSDTSLIYSTIGPATSTFEAFGDEVAAATGQEPTLDIDSLPQSRITKRAQERVLINELYAAGYLGDHVALVGGKKRTYWGGAFTWSPMDIINPARNPLEPTLEREGSWSALADFIFDDVTVSALYSPTVVDNSRGLPTSWDFKDGRSVLRLYLNPFYQDINVAALYQDQRLKGAVTYSGYPVGAVEVHAEALVQRGRPTWLVDRRSPTSDLPDLEAPWSVTQAELTNGKPYVDFLVGSRYNFVDNSYLIAEYYYRSAGYTPDEYDTYVDYLRWLEETLPAVAPQAEALLSQTSEDAASTPQTLADDMDTVVASWTEMLTGTPWLFQDPYLRRHYLSVAYSKAKALKDTDLRMSGIVGLEDGTFILYPSFESRLAQSLLLTGGVIVVLADERAQGQLFPDKATFNLRMTAFF